VAVVVGLGNPGSKYCATRHNMGFMVVDRLARRCKVRFTERRYRADVARTVRKGRSLVLVKPRTFMNESGRSVAAAAAICARDFSDLLIVLDDVYLEFGRLRLRRKGSDGGHNGLASVLEQCSTTEVPRLRVGIGGEDAADRIEYVLGEFTPEERELLPAIIEQACDAVLAWFHSGIDTAMNEINPPLHEEEEPKP